MTPALIITCICSGISFGIGLILCTIMLKKINSKLAENERCCETKAWHIESADRVYRRFEQMQMEFRDWRQFGYEYGCFSPNDVRKLIDNLVSKINKLEKTNGR